MNAMVISATTLSSRRTSDSAAGGPGPWRFQPATEAAAGGGASRPASSKPEQMQLGSVAVPVGSVPSVSVPLGSAQAGPGMNGGGRARLQLTRRGRLVLLGVPAILTAAVMVFAALAIGLGSIATPAQASAGYAAVDLADYAVPVTVLPGDNLWSIASASNPHGDIRDVVSEIVALNELGSGVLQAGQRLYVPLPK